MSTWEVVLVAAAAAYALKLSGFFVPAAILERPRIERTAALMTVGLLAALVANQTFTSGQQVMVDARLPAVIVAGGLLALRTPFIAVVIVAAAVAAGIRALGWMG